MDRACRTPLGILGLLDETQQVLFVEGEFTVVVFGFAQHPAVGQQLLNHVILKREFVCLTHLDNSLQPQFTDSTIAGG